MNQFEVFNRLTNGPISSLVSDQFGIQYQVMWGKYDADKQIADFANSFTEANPYLEILGAPSGSWEGIILVSQLHEQADPLLWGQRHIVYDANWKGLAVFAISLDPSSSWDDFYYSDTEVSTLEGRMGQPEFWQEFLVKFTTRAQAALTANIKAFFEQFTPQPDEKTITMTVKADLRNDKLTAALLEIPPQVLAASLVGYRDIAQLWSNYRETGLSVEEASTLLYQEAGKVIQGGYHKLLRYK